MLVRSGEETDPLSDILALAEVETVVTGEFRASGPWGLRFPPPEGLKFLAIVQGAALLRIDSGEGITLSAGDVALLNHQSPYALSSSMDTPVQDGQALFRALEPGHRVLVVGDGVDIVLVGGHVRLDRERGRPLAQLLPPVLRIASDDAEAPRMQWLLSELMRERTARHLGHQVLSSHLVQMLFLQVLRSHLSRQGLPPSSWLRVLADPRLLPAVKCMHAEPGRAWQLHELAAASAMSRTSFAVRFREVAGMTPMNYLAHWRMLLAQHALRHQTRPMASWVAELGYASESAFSHAFKRIVGMSASDYRAMK